jgi:CBS domain-containing protein
MSSMQPSTAVVASLVVNLRQELMKFQPFAQMAVEHVDRYVGGCSQSYFEPDEVVLSPAQGPIAQLLFIRRGSITAHREGDASAANEHEAGDLLPVSAALTGRPVRSTYKANVDTFCLSLPMAEVQAIAAQSAPFADFLNERVQHFLDLSRRALQVMYAQQSLAEQSLETPLGDLLRRSPYTVTPDVALGEALRAMHDKRIGSVIVVDESQGAAVGILTRHDVLGRVTLPGLSLTTPIESVMSAPLLCLNTKHTAQDAALLMSRRAVRHVPVCDETGRVVGIVSERDLFALQRLSLKQVSTAIRTAPDVDTLRAVALDIQRFARNLLGQGVGAKQLTELISHLNDVLTERLVTLVAAQHGIDMAHVGWLAFGSEGRSEQTIATDQDNGMVYALPPGASDDTHRQQLLAFALEVNEALDACGYPLCKGHIMASNPELCLTTEQWLARMAAWVEHGTPEDVLNANIYFDLRPLVGHAELAAPLLKFLHGPAVRQPRFLRLMADNALRNSPALTWTGAIDTEPLDGEAVVDLKLRGTAICADAARILAMANGVTATGTRARLEGAAHAMGVAPQEAQSWTTAFEFLQMLRLRVQLDNDSSQAVDASDGNPNLVDVGALNDIDRRMLKESLRVAKRLQQRLQMDFLR